MLRLPADADGRAPDDEGGPGWRLPPALIPSTASDGAPDVRLCRYEGGGSLRLRLRAETVTERAVPMQAGRLRFVLSTPAGATHGEWHPVGPRAADLVDVLLPLTPEEAAVARRVGEVGGPLVEVEVELGYTGRLPRLPWTATADTATVQASLTGPLGPSPWTVEAVEQALEAVDPGTLRWSPSYPGAPPRNDALLRPALVAALLEALFVSGPAGLEWATAEPTLRLDLEVGRVAVRRWVRRWSFSAFHTSLADPSRHFVDIDRPVPFETRTLFVTNTLPIGPDAVDTLMVEVDAGEITGLVTVSFTADSPPTARVPFVHRSSTAPPRWRIRALVRGQQGLVPFETAWKDADPLLIDLTPDTTGIHPVSLEIAGEVWDLADAVTVTIGSRTASFARGSTPGVWMFRQHQPSATVRWARGERSREATVPIPEGRLAVGTDALLPNRVVPVRLTPGPTLLAEAAWVALVQGDRMETLEPEGVTRLAVRRSVLEDPELPYRLVLMRRRPDGAVDAAETTEERVARGETVVL